MSNPELARAAQQELVDRELARKSLIAFTERFNPDYCAGWVHKLVAANLEKFLEDVRAHRSPRLMLFLPPRSGKLLAHSTRMWSNKGLVTHGDLEVGDFVFDEKGELTLVKAVSEEANADWIVTISDGTKIRCHENHEWTILHRQNKKKGWFTVDTKWFVSKTKHGKKRQLYYGELGKRGCSYAYAIPDNSEPLKYPPKELPIHPYMLGVWLGDGTASKPTICFDPRKRQHIDKLISLGYVPSSEYPHSKDPSYRNVHYANYSKSTSDLPVQLSKLGLLHNKHIPDEYLTASVEQRLELLAGLIDTDGCVDSKSRVMFSNTDHDIIQGYYTLCESLALRPYWMKPQQPALSSSGIQGKKVVYSIGFQPHIPIPTVVKTIKRLVTNRRLLSIVSVEYKPNGEKGRCIEVDNPSGLYRAGSSGVPTHNSALASQMFPAWTLGHWPEAEFMVASYSAALTLDFSRTVKGLLDDPAYHTLFPETRLDPNSKAVDNWFTTRSGRYFPTSVGGSLTGKGCNILICDDLVKDSEVADSESQLDKIYEWYTSTALTRLAPDSGVIQIMTRWSDLDPAGRLLAHQEEQERFLIDELEACTNDEYREFLKRELDNIERWNVISFPALAERDEYITPNLTISYHPEPGYIHVRSKDQALHPERFDEGALGRIKKALPPRQWNALYQQNPVPEEGSFFQKPWFRYHQVVRYPEFPVLQAWDFAIGQRSENDWTVGVTGFLDYNGLLHIIDMVRIQEGTYGIVQTMADQIQKHSPSLIGMERGHISMSVLPVLEEELKSRRLFPSIDADMVPVSDKVLRARPLQGMLQRGMVSADPSAPWYDTLMQEFLRFPHGRHDDIVDACAYLAKMAMDTPVPSKPTRKNQKSWKDKLKRHMAPRNKLGIGHLGA